jgi:HEAT repeat protein
VADRERIDALVRGLDDDPDPLHLDMTPAVHALGEVGVEAVPALAGALEAPSEDTRLRAQRALEAIVQRRHGFVPGQGFPGERAEQDARDELAKIGYDSGAEPSERAAAIERLRDWHSATR